jgi:hypothetical protein
MCVRPRPDPNPHLDVTAGLPLGRRVRIGEKVESGSLGDKTGAEMNRRVSPS